MRRQYNFNSPLGRIRIRLQKKTVELPEAEGVSNAQQQRPKAMMVWRATGNGFAAGGDTEKIAFYRVLRAILDAADE